MYFYRSSVFNASELSPSRRTVRAARRPLVATMVLLGAASGCSASVDPQLGEASVDTSTSALTIGSWNTQLTDSIAWSDPAIIVEAPGRKVDVLYGGDNTSVRRRQFDAATGWAAEVDLDGRLIGKPVGISWSAFGSGDTDDVRIFGRGLDSSLWQISRKSTGLGWDYVGGALASAPSAASWGPGRVDVFYLGPDTALRHRYFEGAWSGEENLGGQLLGDPASVALNGRVDTVVRAKSGGIAHSWWDGRWNWETLSGGDVASDPAIASWGGGRLDLFYRGASGTLKHRYTTHYSDWSAEQDLGGAIQGTPAAASWKPGHIEVMARDTSNHVIRRSWDGPAATTEPTAACVPRAWPTDGTCAGPWRFARHAANCDTKTTVTDYSCLYQAGTIADPPPTVVTVTPAARRRSECNDAGKCHLVTEYDYATPCSTAARAKATAQNATSGVGVATEQPRDNCRISLKNVPQMVYGLNTAYCKDLPPAQRTASSHDVYTSVPVERCPIIPGSLYSPSGMTYASLVTAQPAIVQGAIGAPVCMTEDTTNPGADPTAEFDRLLTTLRTASSRVPGGSVLPLRDTTGAYLNDAALESALVDRLLLLGETYGDKLRSDQRAFVLTLAKTFSELANTCATSFAAPAKEATCAQTPVLDGALAYCARLNQVNVPAHVTEAFLDDCISTASDLASAYPISTSTCAADAYRELERTTSRGMLNKVFLGAPPPAAAERAALLAHRLKVMGTWFDLHRATPRSAPSADQLLDSSNVMASLWKGVHDRTFGSVETIARDSSATPDSIANAVASLQTNNFEAEREVLAAAYSGTDGAPTLANELLLDLTGDALRPMLDQLRAATKFHDFACQVDDCRPASAQAGNELESVWQMLSALPNAQSLGDASRTAPAGSWSAAFATIASHHAALERAAVAPEPRAYADADLTTLGAKEIDRGGLAGIVREANTRMAVFAKTGRFDPTGTDSLRTGLQKEKRDELAKLVDSRTAAASSALSALQRQRADAVTTLVANLQGTHDLEALRNRALAKNDDFNLLTTNLAALRAGIEADERSISEFNASFDAVAKKTSATAFTITRTEQEISVPALGVANTPRARNWTNIAVVATPWKLSAEAGEIVNMDVSNVWSPVCAFQTSRGPDFQLIDATGAITGSEGFIAREENNRFKAAQYSSYNSSSHAETTTSSKCEGLGVKEGLSYAGMDVLPEISQTQSDCVATEDGIRYGENDTNTTGSEHRESASFSVGIHLDDTPFPTAPAGALLAVIMPRGSTARTAMLDVRVVTPHTSIVLDTASDIYLVVNDAQCPQDSGALTVHVTQLTPAGDLAKKLGAVMAGTLSDLRALEPRLRAEGRMLPEDTAARRQAAVARLDASLPSGTFANFPAFQSLFFSWLDGELALLRRRIEVDALEHQRGLEVLEISTIADDVRRAAQASRYLELSSRWALENVDASLLSTSADALREVVGEYLLPLAHIRFPAAIDGFARTKDTSAIARLRGASLATSLAGLVKDEVTIVNGLSNAVSTAMLNSTTTSSNVRFAGISIPNPNTTSGLLSALRPVDPATASSVWQELVDTKHLRFTLSPEQIYDSLGGKGVLLCGDAVPVINAMAIYIGRDEGGEDPNDPRNTVPTLVPARFDTQMMFPQVTGNATYSFNGDSWLSSNMRVLYGQPIYGVNVLSQQLNTSQQQAGLSPFARLDVNLERVASDPSISVATAPEIDLIYQLDTQSVGGQGLSGIGTCR